MRSYDAVVFDFDGTLFNTLEVSLGGFNIIRDFFGAAPLNIEDAKKLVGPPFHEILLKMYPMIKDSEASVLHKTVRNYYLKQGCALSQPYKGIRELLDQLSKRKIKLGIASMKDTVLINQTLHLNNLSTYFTSVCGCEDGIHEKSALLRSCLSCLDAENGVMVGDSHSDWEAARKTGCDFIAAGFGYGLT